MDFYKILEESGSYWIVFFLFIRGNLDRFFTFISHIYNVSKLKVITLIRKNMGKYIIVRNRGESSLFKTLEECEQKCKEINQGDSSAAF